jgi:hypothetical protein
MGTMASKRGLSGSFTRTKHLADNSVSLREVSGITSCTRAMSSRTRILRARAYTLQSAEMISQDSQIEQKPNE